ncbi:Glutathione S-transferase L1, partial [Linum grandiflorum]
NAREPLPPSLDSTSHAPPPPFNGTAAARLYTSYRSPFAQRAWIARNCKGLKEQIQLVPINLEDKPSWYKQVNPQGKVPALEHNGKIIVESLDILRYVDTNFEGPPLFPNELLAYSETFTEMVLNSFKGETVREADPAFDVVEAALGKFKDGPFFLGRQVDIAYIPFVERAEIFLPAAWNYDISAGRPQLAGWIQEMNRIDGYKETKSDSREVVGYYKNRFLVIV